MGDLTRSCLLNGADEPLWRDEGQLGVGFPETPVHNPPAAIASTSEGLSRWVVATACRRGRPLWSPGLKTRNRLGTSRDQGANPLRSHRRSKTIGRSSDARTKCKRLP
jgi:hypothetical protein